MNLGPMILSTRFKEAVKTALAMVIAFGIALAMGWDRPYWAGLTVAVVSRGTLGESVIHAGWRILGTLTAAVVAISLIALFPQDRWLFMLYLSLWIGLCVYMVVDVNREYFWTVSAFVSMIIAIDSGPDFSINAFDTAILRAQETGLGVLVYSLVALLLWPTSSRPTFEAAARQLAKTHRALAGAYLKEMRGQGNAVETADLRVREVQQHTRFDQLLDAAVGDNWEVWEVRRHWRRYGLQVAELTTTLERWRESFDELRDLDLPSLFPNLTAFGAEIEARFAQAGRMLDDQEPNGQPVAVELAIDEEQLRSLSNFDRAAVAVTRLRLQRLERLTQSLCKNLSYIKGLGPAPGLAEIAGAPVVNQTLDLDRLTSAVRQIVIIWLAVLIWFFVPGMPDGTAFVIMSASFGINLAVRPQFSVSAMVVPIAGGIFLALLLYVFLMPRLETFTGLGLMLFTVTFATNYIFGSDRPRDVMVRRLGLAMFLIIISISNDQTYDFLGRINTATAIALILPLIGITAYIPVSLQPDEAFLRLLRRFFRSSDYLMSTMRWGRKETLFNKWRKKFHAYEVATLPRKLGVWSRFIETRLCGLSPEHLNALVANLGSVSYRIQELLEARANPQADFLVQELVMDFRASRLTMQSTMERLISDPASVEGQAFRAEMADVIGQLESRVETALNASAAEQITAEESENFYRLMGAFRGLSDALVTSSQSADGIDWKRWREARF